MKGSYNRRNVYGAVLPYGPVLDANPHMKGVYEEVLTYIAKKDASFLRELGVALDEVEDTITIVVEPRTGAELPHLNLEKEVSVR